MENRYTKGDKITIQLRIMGAIVKTYKPKTYREARKLYAKLMQYENQYAYVIVNRRHKPTAQAEEYFKMVQYRKTNKRAISIT